MPVLIAVLLALLWVFALRRWYRQAPSPLESVEHQQRALDALQHAASRARSPISPADTAIRSVPSVPLRAGRPKRSFTPVVVALVGTLVLAGVGAIWWVGRNTNQKQSATPATAKRHRAAATTTTTVPATATTATTSPAVAQATITKQSANAVDFAVNRPAFTVAVATSARCWVRVQDPHQPGAPLFEGIMQAGDTRPIPVNGALVLRLGAANNATLTLDGQPLALPAQSGSTLTLTFNGSSNGA